MISKKIVREIEVIVKDEILYSIIQEVREKYHATINKGRLEAILIKNEDLLFKLYEAQMYDNDFDSIVYEIYILTLMEDK